MFASALKWAGAGIIISYIIASCRKQVTLTSLTEAPSDLYPPEFYPNGTDLQLPFGIMRYWQFGDEDGGRVVLIHGITTGSSVYDKLARDLADNGHHVLVYDLWGRGYSQAPAANYDDALYTSQLAMLLQKVGWEKTNVVGVSLGGGIATAFTSLYPEMVNKLVLIAPVGLMKDNEKPLVSKALNIPFVHHFITTHPYVRPLLTGFIKRYAQNLHKVEPGLDTETAATVSKITKIATYQFVHHPGFLRAFLDTVVSFPFTDMTQNYKEVGLQNRSILIIWGDQDTIVPFGNHKEALEFMPNAKLIVHKDKGHDVIITLWRTVNQEIKEFLNYK